MLFFFCKNDYFIHLWYYCNEPIKCTRTQARAHTHTSFTVKQSIYWFDALREHDWCNVLCCYYYFLRNQKKAGFSAQRFVDLLLICIPYMRRQRCRYIHTYIFILLPIQTEVHLMKERKKTEGYIRFGQSIPSLHLL